MPDNPHAHAASEVLAQLQVAGNKGLSDDAAAARLRHFGPNAVASRRATSVLRLIWHQFESPVVYLLSAAATLALLFGEVEEFGAIVIVLLLNATIGLITEFKAARSIEALRALGSHMARVRRAGEARLIPAVTIVPGDIVLLDAGDAVTADLRLIETSALAADESTLTGESVAVAKDITPVPLAARATDQTSMLFKGTTVTRGSGVGVVVATGLSTELGHITQLVLDAQPGSSPLEKKLSRLSTELAWTTLLIATGVGIVGLFTHPNFLLVVETAIALAVAAIPEGLPIVATLTLARGMWRMARQNALVEHLSAVETLGATTLILTDKTGTLTENRMAVRSLAVPAGPLNFDPRLDHGHTPAPPAESSQIRDLLRTAVLCNDAHLPSIADKGSGDPMEIALLRAGMGIGLIPADLLRENRIIRKYAFDPNIKMMATVHVAPPGFLVAVKGAPEAVLSAARHVATDQGLVDISDSIRAEWLSRASALGERGLRVLACATRATGSGEDSPYQNLVLIGLIGLEDPPRADVAEAIQHCQHAGIRVVMVTGDHAVTARS
ncbi:MAG: cation-transporting P-type ATPase, partial [Alphaproteobacteria bacterium]|nr:cation-transporting P-type ATPase [Alphaproteobacteria bacterium]